MGRVNSAKEDISVDVLDKMTCPQCTATLSNGTVRCTCDHLFGPFKPQDPLAALELAAQEEKLHEEYLAARVEQAAEAVRIAATVVAMEPGNARRAAEAARANRVVKAAKVELTAQQARVTQAELAVITTTTGVTGEVYRED